VDELRSATAALRSTRAELRWASPDKWHLTLAFLGEVGDPARADLSTRLGRTAARHPPMRLALHGAGRGRGRGAALPAPPHPGPCEWRHRPAPRRRRAHRLHRPDVDRDRAAPRAQPPRRRAGRHRPARAAPDVAAHRKLITPRSGRHPLRAFGGPSIRRPGAGRERGRPKRRSSGGAEWPARGRVPSRRAAR